MTGLLEIMNKKFTQKEDSFIKENINKCRTLWDLLEIFKKEFPERTTISYGSLVKRMQKLGVKKGTHNIRKGKVKSKNEIGTIICYKDGKKARVKTENGYIQANAHFKLLYWGISDKSKYIVHLNGDFSDFSEDNLVLVDKFVFFALTTRNWFFKDKELTRTAILTVELLSFFPDLKKNENQYYKMIRSK